MSQNEIEQIELTIEEAQKLVDRAAMIRRLTDNPDFKAVIIEGYFTTEAARLANIFSHPNMQKDRALVENDLMGMGGLRRYLSTALQMGDTAEDEIAQAREELDEIRAED